MNQVEVEPRRSILERKLVCCACRTRKKRCGGERPACVSCRKRNERCEYGPAAVARASASAHDHNNPGLGAVGTPPWPQLNPSPFFPPAAVPPTGHPPVATMTGPLLSVSSSSLEPSPNAPTEHGLVPWDNLNLWPLDWNDSTPKQSPPYVGLYRPELAGPFPASLGPDMDCSPPSSRSNGPDEVLLPPLDECIGLIDVYFKLIHPFLPLLHEEALKASVVDACSPMVDLSPTATSPARRSTGLLFAVLTLASNERQDETSKDLRTSWYNEAKRQYALTSHIPASPIETLQTAVCIILQALISIDSSSIWLVLGKAWKQVVALGYHRLDRKQPCRMPGAPALPDDWIQRESVRRIVWMLYILDRTACLPVGLDFTIDDKQLGVNLPMSDPWFQGQTTPPSDSRSIPYIADVSRLVSTIRESFSQTKEYNSMHHVITNVMMLSRVVSHSQLGEEDHTEAEEGFARLESDLFTLRVSLPRSTTSLSATSHQDLSNAVWVNFLLNLNNIFLIYSKTAEATEISADDWGRCVATARNTISIIRQAANISVDSLLNPHVTSAIFLCGRILVIEYLLPPSPDVTGLSSSLASGHEPKDQSLWRDIEAINLVFERLEELFAPIGRKFKNGMRFYLKQDAAELHRIKNSGVKDLLAQCSSWETGA